MGRESWEKMRQAMFSLIYFVSKFTLSTDWRGREHGNGPDVGTRSVVAAWPKFENTAQ